MARVEMESSSDVPSQGGLGSFRDFMPDLSQPRFTAMQQQDPHEYVEDFLERKQPPWLYGLYRHWRQLYEEPFRGVTVDGKFKSWLYHQ